MFFGALAAMGEKRLRKFLAYSSVNQMGFLLIGVVGACPQTFEPSLIYLLIYILMNMGFFIILLNTFEIHSSRMLSYLSDLTYFVNSTRSHKIILTIRIAVLKSEAFHK